MKKNFSIISFFIIVLLLFSCSKKPVDSSGDSSAVQPPVLTEDAKVFLGKWKAALAGVVGKDQIWTFKKDGTFLWEFSGMTYDGNFSIKNKVLTVIFPAQTTVYKVLEQSEAKIKLTTVVNGKEYITFLTKI